MSQTPVVSTSTADVIVLDGDLDIARAVELAEHLDRSMEERSGDLMLESAAVSFIDACALGVLVDAANRLALSGRTLRMLSASPCVRRILEITELAGLLPTTR